MVTGTVIAFPSLLAGGPGSGRRPTGVAKVLPLVNKLGKAIITPKQQLALRSARPAGKAEQDMAERGEQMVHRALPNSVRSANNKPFDILTRDGKHAVEVKTITNGANDKITMSRNAMERKYEYANNFGLKLHTVVVDMRGGKFNGVYHKEGVGSFRLGGMTKLAGMKNLDNAIRRSRA